MDLLAGGGADGSDFRALVLVLNTYKMTDMYILKSIWHFFLLVLLAIVIMITGISVGQFVIVPFIELITK